MRTAIGKTIDDNEPEISRNWTSCTACEQCQICKQPLNTFDVEWDAIYKVHDEYGDKLIRMDLGYYHKPCFDNKQSIEAEKKRQSEEEGKRRLQEQLRQKAQAERQRRIQNALCVTCGSQLGFMDKMAGRQSHKRC